MIDDVINKGWGSPRPPYQLTTAATFFNNPNFGTPQYCYFPIGAFPPKLYGSAEEVCAKFKTAPEIIFASQVTTISAAAQTSYKIRRHNGIETPISLFSIIVTDSGMRKSSVDTMFAQALDSVEWPSTLDTSTPISQEMQGDEPPAEQDKRSIVFRDTTPEALFAGLNKCPTATLIANDAGDLLKSRTVSKLPAFNTLWDGQSYKVDRASGKSFILKDARLTLSLMVQPKVFTDYLQTNGRLSQGNGFFARCLFAYVHSANYIGTRFENLQDLHRGSCSPEMDKFKIRIHELCKQSMTPDGKKLNKPVILEFEHQAKLDCLDFHNGIEAAMAQFQPLSDISEAGSKALDNMCRLAALFHIYEGEQGNISSSTVHRASAFILWYLNSYKCQFGQRAQQPSAMLDAQILKNWVFNQLLKVPNMRGMLRNAMRKNCPNVLRKDKRFDGALSQLAAACSVRIKAEGKAAFVEFNQAEFQPCMGQTMQPAVFSPFALSYSGGSLPI